MWAKCFKWVFSVGDQRLYLSQVRVHEDDFKMSSSLHFVHISLKPNIWSNPTTFIPIYFFFKFHLDIVLNAFHHICLPHRRLTTYWELAGSEGSHARSRRCLLRRCAERRRGRSGVSPQGGHGIRTTPAWPHRVSLASGMHQQQGKHKMLFTFFTYLFILFYFLKGETSYIRVYEDRGGANWGRSRSRSRSRGRYSPPFFNRGSPPRYPSPPRHPMLRHSPPPRRHPPPHLSPPPRHYR